MRGKEDFSPYLIKRSKFRITTFQKKIKIKSPEVGMDMWWGVDHPHPPSSSSASSWSHTLSLHVFNPVSPATVKPHGACIRDQKLSRSRLRGATGEDTLSFASVDATRWRGWKPFVAFRPLSLAMEANFGLLTTCWAFWYLVCQVALPKKLSHSLVGTEL